MSDEAVRISKNAQVLRFFAARRKRLDRTKHLKLAYMADLVAHEYLGRPLTSFAYRYDQYGPFDPHFYEAREELVCSGLATREQTPYGKYEGQTLVHVDRPSVEEFTPVERMILQHVYDTCAHLTLQQLLRKVYQTVPMEKAEEGGRVPMEVVNNRGTEELGFDLEELAAAEARIDSGRFLTLDQLISGVRSEIRR